MDEGTKTCPNCKKEIPAGNFTIHSVYCTTRLIVCEKCKEPIRRNDIQTHLDSFHKKISCDQCHEKVEKGEIKLHQEEHCCKRIVLCSYCDLEKPFSDMSEHEQYCGARTEKCEDCGQYVMMKNRSVHTLHGGCRKIIKTPVKSNISEEEKVQICPNCQKEIPAANYTIHSVYCKTRLTVCEKCKESVPRNALQDHYDYFHKRIPCEQCHEMVENIDMDLHKEEQCSRRLVTCLYCDVAMSFADIHEHEDYCGARTEKCDECKQYIMIKNLPLHVTSGECRKMAAAESMKTPASNSAIVNDFASYEDDLPKIKVNKISIIKREVSQLNPNKRTNDMPQVNTDAVGNRSKETSKQDLRSGRSGVSDEIDALLALQLSEQDSTSPQEAVPAFENYSPLMPPIEFFDSLQEDIFNPLPTSPLRTIWDDLDDNMSTNNLFSLPRRMGLPEHRAHEAESDIDLLPCEFCGKLNPVDMLILHQSGCRPDLAHGMANLEEASEDFYDENADGDQVQLIAATADSDIGHVSLPCEFCGLLFLSKFLVDHQNYCEENPCFREASPAKLPDDKNVLPQSVSDKILTKSREQENNPFLDITSENAVNIAKSSADKLKNRYHVLPSANMKAGALNEEQAEPTFTESTKSKKIEQNIPIKLAAGHPSLRSKPKENPQFTSANGLISVRVRNSGSKNESLNDKMFEREAQKQMGTSRGSSNSAEAYQKYNVQASPRKCHNRSEDSGHLNVKPENAKRTDLPRHLDVGNRGIHNAYRDYLTSGNLRRRVTSQNVNNQPDMPQGSSRSLFSVHSRAGAVPKNKDMDH